MNVDGLLDHLGYRESAGFLDASRWHEAPEHAHVLRHTADACLSAGGSFRGSYMLGLHQRDERRATTPVVFVVQAPDEVAADAIHHIVWNQAIVPFLMVWTPAGVRLYTGFDYEPEWSPASKVPRSQRGVLEALITFEQVAAKLDAFRAEQVDDGGLWARWGDRVEPSRRVDVRLLGHLADLGRWLRDEAKLAPPVAHALIGRFVYLRYLRERNILSDKLLQSWDVDPIQDFGRSIRLRSFRALLDRVDERLNGSIFPLPFSGDQAPSLEHIRAVAGVMLGDDPHRGQLHLDFRAYDFSHIPVETLSAIYEQFMAAEGRDRSAGGFYTPIPLVNFVLGELDDLCPLQSGMRVFDPACGSGAFLVQCYQLLIEKRRRETGGGDLSPRELRELLTTHIFGMDRDEDACRVTEFSLALALLDQIPAETLTRLHNFKLPDLHGTNILHGDFFAGELPAGGSFDWIVGNPPWVTASDADPSHRSALRWMKAHHEAHPVSGHQLAEGFAWHALSALRPGGMVAFVMPATTLFKEQRSFRERFFAEVDLKVVVNLTNLREVLFEGRARTPATLLFYMAPGDVSQASDVAVYSPFVVNQEAIRPAREGERRGAWTITADHGEVSFVSRGDVVAGDPLPWKVSMWGSQRDTRLLQRVARRFPSLEKAAEGRWSICEGLPLRERLSGSSRSSDALVHLPDIEGKPRLLVPALRSAKHVHSFPESAFAPVAKDLAHARKRGGTAGLAVCRPPHVVVHAARSFAVYSGEFVVIPPPQVGIAGRKGDEDALRALALYLGSAFVWYHQFLTSPEMDVRGRSTIEGLRRLPVPLVALSHPELGAWTELHEDLVALSDRRWALLASTNALIDVPAIAALEDQMRNLEHTVNDLTATALGLRLQERWLIEDLVHVRSHLADGKIGAAAAAAPTEAQMTDYAAALRDELDAYLDRGHRFRHALTIVHEARAGMVQIVFSPSAAPHPPRVEPAHGFVGQKLRAVRDRIEREHGQWLYFDRNLVSYRDGEVFIAKPMQRVWWTRSQALADADRIIADLVATGAHA